MIRLLDLYCGAGGCAVGYVRAAQALGLEIEVVGVDNKPQPSYPYSFVLDDAVAYCLREGHKYTHIHASPPCQAYSAGTAPHRHNNEYADLVAVTRSAMEQTGLTGVIENVPQAPIRPDIVLWGTMFGLKVLRKRHFELLGWWAMCPMPPAKVGSVSDGDFISVYGNASYCKSSRDRVRKPKFAKNSVRETWSYAMGIDWMQKDVELAQSVPPAYTEWIGTEWFTSTI